MLFWDANALGVVVDATALRISAFANAATGLAATRHLVRRLLCCLRAVECYSVQVRRLAAGSGYLAAPAFRGE